MKVAAVRLRLLAAVLAAALAALLGGAAAASAGSVNAGIAGASSDPLAHVIWGTYYEPFRTDPGFDPPSWQFNHSYGAAKVAYGQILGQPRFRWFGDWYPTYSQGNVWGAREAVTRYIDQVTHGDPDIGVQIGVFRLQPFEACGLMPTSAQQNGYRAWIREFAAGIGATRAAIVLQPDMPFTMCAKYHSPVYYRLISYAAQRFSALPYSTTYIDAGAADWLGQKDGSKVTPAHVASMLARSGIRYARGFSVNLTHYDSTANEVAFAHRVIRALNRMGIRNKHAVVNTAQNGRPFTTQKHWRTFKAGTVCATPSSRNCVTLGHPPAVATGDPAIDAFLWMGRPWLNNATRRSGAEILRLVTTSPYRNQLPAFTPQLPAFPLPNLLALPGLLRHI